MLLKQIKVYGPLLLVSRLVKQVKATLLLRLVRLLEQAVKASTQWPLVRMLVQQACLPIPLRSTPLALTILYNQLALVLSMLRQFATI